MKVFWLGSAGRMADSDIRETAAELRISRVKALSDQDLLGMVTYLLARYRTRSLRCWTTR